MGLGSGIRDPGSGKNLFRIPDPGVKKAPDPGSGSATLLQINLMGSGSIMLATKYSRFPLDGWRADIVVLIPL